ncbi:MAG: GntR family transcriptional regulator [Victivallaceae bacterium]
MNKITELTSRKPKHVIIADTVREQIFSGALERGSRLISDSDFARKYKINERTVAAGLNTLVREGLLERIPGRGTFVKEKSASKTVAFIGYYINQDCGEIINGIEETLSKNGYLLTVKCSGGNFQTEKKIVEELADEISGLIVYPLIIKNKHNAAVFKNLQKKHFPFVLVDRYYENFECDYSGVDNYSGSYDVTESLIRKGHRRIAHIVAPSQSSVVRERLEGYLGALKDHKIPFDADLVRQLPFREDFNHSYMKEISSIVNKLLQLKSPPTAITSTADGLSVLAMKVLLAKGIKIPQNMALAGFDNGSLGLFAEIPLTTVGVDFFQIGKSAAELLLCRLRNKDFSPVKKIIQPVSLIERQSSNPDFYKNGSYMLEMMNKKLNMMNFA